MDERKATGDHEALRGSQWLEVATAPGLEGQSKMPKSQGHLVETGIIMNQGPWKR